MAEASLLIRIKADGAGVAKGVSAATGHFSKLDQAARGIGRRVTAAAGAWFGLEQIKKTVEFGARMDDLSQRMGVGTEALQAWDYAAQKGGATIEDVAGSYKKMQIAQIKALAGDEQQIEAFGRLGVTAADLKAKKPEQLFEQLGATIGKMPHSAQLVADMVEVFGKQGDTILPIFRDGFADAAEEARKLGVVIQDDTIKKLAALDDRLMVTGKRLTATLAEPLATFVGWIEKAIRYVTRLLGFIGGVAGGLSAGLSLKEAKAAAQRQIDEAYPKEPDVAPAAAGKRIEQVAPDTTGVKTKKSRERLSVGAPKGDELTRIGLFRGAGDRTLVEIARLQQSQLTRLEQLAAATTSIDATVKRTTTESSYAMVQSEQFM
jgi:hypothetical protein